MKPITNPTVTTHTRIVQHNPSARRWFAVGVAGTLAAAMFAGVLIGRVGGKSEPIALPASVEWSAAPVESVRPLRPAGAATPPLEVAVNECVEAIDAFIATGAVSGCVAIGFGEADPFEVVVARYEACLIEPDRPECR